MLQVISNKLNAVTNAAHVMIAAHAHALLVPPLHLTVLLKPLEPLLSLPIEESRTSTESLRTVKEKLRPEITKEKLKTPLVNLETRSLPTLIRLKLKTLLMTPRKKLMKSPLQRQLLIKLPLPLKRLPIKLRMLPRKLLKSKKKKRKRRRKKRRKKRKRKRKKKMKKKKRRKVRKRKVRKRKEKKRKEMKRRKKSLKKKKHEKSTFLKGF